MQGAARQAGAVARAAVPQVAVEDDHRAGRGDELHLVWVGGGRIGHRVARRHAEPVRAGHHPGSAVVGGEIVQEPDRVAYLVLTGRDRPAPVGVQCLMALAGQGGAEVERGELEPAQHMGDARQYPRVTRGYWRASPMCWAGSSSPRSTSAPPCPARAIRHCTPTGAGRSRPVSTRYATRSGSWTISPPTTALPGWCPARTG